MSLEGRAADSGSESTAHKVYHFVCVYIQHYTRMLRLVNCSPVLAAFAFKRPSLANIAPLPNLGDPVT